MLDLVVDLPGLLATFEEPSVYLKEGDEEPAIRGEESTEAEGIREIIIGNGLQVRFCVSHAYFLTLERSYSILGGPSRP